MPYFEALKMLGNVFIIEDPKELAQLVRDSSVFRGTLTPDDVYEFLQVSDEARQAFAEYVTTKQRRALLSTGPLRFQSHRKGHRQRDVWVQNSGRLHRHVI